MPPQQLFNSEEPPPPIKASETPVHKRVTLSHFLQFLIVVGLGVLVWQVVLLRRAVMDSRPETPSGALEVEVINRRPLKVEVDNSELDVNVTNTELDVNVTNTVNVSTY